MPPVFLGRSVAAAGPPLFLGRVAASTVPPSMPRAGRSCSRPLDQKVLQARSRHLIPLDPSRARSVRLKPRAVGSGLACRISRPGPSPKGSARKISLRDREESLGRRRCGSTNSDARCTSSAATLGFPSQAARARADLYKVTSARIPECQPDNKSGLLSAASCRGQPRRKTRRRAAADLLEGLLFRAPGIDEPHWVGVECNSPPDLLRYEAPDHEGRPLRPSSRTGRGAAAAKALLQGSWSRSGGSGRGG